MARAQPVLDSRPIIQARHQSTLQLLDTPCPESDSAYLTSDTDPNYPTIGSILGKYELVGRIGRGSTSIVFRGLHRKLQIPVAVKILQSDALANSPQLLELLMTEALLLAQLNHPHIVRLWDLEDEGTYPYLVLEYVPGVTLAELISQTGAVPIPFAFAILRQAVEGLAEAHKLGIVHRDVKPGNLLLGRDGVVKVADFGLATVVSNRLSRQASAGRGASWPAGTAAYLAPEQARDPSKVDFRADIYSLGVTLYHALTGRLPFEGRSSAEVIMKHVGQPPVPPGRYLPTLSAACSDLILRMLAKDPKHRFGTYDELRVALARAVGDRRTPQPLAESFPSFAVP